ncbi:hypothetical protein ACVBEJ_04355 [Porticoccus sp. GXU_MW_L64]
MKYVKLILAGVMLAISTIASVKILFFGVYVEDITHLKTIRGELSSITCKKNRYLRSIKLKGNSTRYWLEQKPKRLPSCESAKEQWPIGSNVQLSHTTRKPGSDTYAYVLTVNDIAIFGYDEAVESINSSKNIVLGYSAFIWGLLLVVVLARKNKHNKQRLSDA